MKTVLVVEDEKMIRRGICAMIRRCPVPAETILECGNARDALEILKTQEIDVMFTDIRMPKMSGIELVERMKEELSELPLIVAVSGYDDFSYAVRMMRLGASEYLLKPVDRTEIAAVMEKLEKTLQEKSQKTAKLKNMELQQIRTLLLQKGAAPLPDTDLLPSEYQIACFGGQNSPETHHLLLDPGEIGGHHLRILAAENLNYLLRNDLQDAHAGISAPHSGAAELWTAYQEAVSARERAFAARLEYAIYNSPESDAQISADGPARDADGRAESGRLSRHASLPDISRMEIIAQQLGTDKAADGIYFLERMAAEARSGRIPPAVFRQNMEALTGRLKELYQDVLQEDAAFGRLLFLYDYPDLDGYMEQFTAWCRDFSRRMSTEFDHYASRQKMEEALSYIQKNYSKDLNMAMVSNHVSMNYSAFSSAFKQHTGQNFVTYLKELRIGEAKRLLSQTDLKIIEISRMVGYDNDKHFMKIFKSVCGVSPSEYRQNQLHQA